MNSGRVNSVLYPSMSAKYSGASGGDIYLYDWGDGNGYSHVAVSTNSGNFANYYDPAASQSYASVTGGSGDRTSQHSNDRVDAPWNWGWYVQPNPVFHSLARTKILHLQ